MPHEIAFLHLFPAHESILSCREIMDLNEERKRESRNKKDKQENGFYEISARFT